MSNAKKTFLLFVAGGFGVVFGWLAGYYLPGQIAIYQGQTDWAGFALILLCTLPMGVGAGAGGAVGCSLLAIKFLDGFFMWFGILLAILLGGVVFPGLVISAFMIQPVAN